ncbi:molybdopterin-dependent oxidoreductase, partial [Candidatus Bathyarchaeota archaeon]|nr:molybdopterin-dependent oxidoreductase [Candidatus Bathyarchaeota archaeon]
MASKEVPKTGEYDKAVHGACYMCDSYCPTKIFIKNGKAIGVEMLDDKTRDLCPRWKAQLDFVYHKDRLQYPLRRIGVRGAGEFERVSWDEALDTTA